MRRGGWDGTEVLVNVCVYDRCVVWPRYVETLLGARFCDGSSALVQNHWYEIIGPRGCNDPFPCNVTIVDIGNSPTFRPVSGTTGKLIRYYVVKRNDVGKTITIFGTQFGGQPLQELDADGNWRDGLTLTAAAPFISTSVMVTHIDRVVRQATQGMSYLYEYDPTANTLRDIAAYEPSETNPLYRRSRIENFCNLNSCQDANGIRYVRIEALVKLAFIPVKNDWDFLAIDNTESLKFAIQGIRLEEANEDALGEAKMLKAVRELNYDLRTKFPQEQTPVVVHAMLGGFVTNPI